MSQLNNFVLANLSRETQHARDYEGPNGWVALGNQLLSKLEKADMYELGKRKEIGVEVFDDYWITLPSDLRRIYSVYKPLHLDRSKTVVKREPGIINGKIRLNEIISNDEDAQTDNLFTLTGGGTTSIEINDDDATEDLWKDYLLVVSGYNGIIIKGNDATSELGPIATCYYLHTQSTYPASGTGYLTDQYLMLEYQSRYTRMVNFDDEIPVDDRYEDLFRLWFNYNSLPYSNKGRPTAKREFEEAWEETEMEQFTASPEESQPDKQNLIGMNCYETSDWPEDETE